MALTANREIKHFVSQELIELPVDDNVNIYKGAFVGLNPTTGYARPLLAGDAFVGIAYGAADNTVDGHTAGGINVTLMQNLDIVHPLAGLGVDDLGKLAFASDDATLTLTDSGLGAVGRIVAVEGPDTARVRCQPLPSVPSDVNPAPFFVLSDQSHTLSPIHLNRTLIIANTQARTLTLPAVALAGFGATLRIVKTSAAAAAVTLDGNAGETINGNTTFVGVDAQYDSVELLCSGTGWVITNSELA